MKKILSTEEHSANLAFLEQLHEEYTDHPSSFDPSWKTFFQELEGGAISSPFSASPVSSSATSQAEKVKDLIHAYRRYGHFLARINPLSSSSEQPLIPQLQLEEWGFQSTDRDKKFPTQGVLPNPVAPLNEIINTLQGLYCQTIGFEFDHVTDVEAKKWIREQIEGGRFTKPFEKEDKHLIFELLTRAEFLESFLHTKHVGKKRFSLEGAETLIPLLSFFVNEAARIGVEEIFIGMSHRGRLNVLANILQKSIEAILKDFDEDYEPMAGEKMGDIRYHKGHANDSIITHQGKSIKLAMAPNPSHLESVDAVIEGQVKGKQIFSGDENERKTILPLLLHGDAAVAGQGIVYETLQMSKLPGYETGGTVHIVINNQIGFTTSPKAGRSTPYCTDIAYAFGMPVFHVNAEDPEACVRIALFALEIRQRFHCDVFIDLYCYRKYGHNEGMNRHSRSLLIMASFVKKNRSDSFIVMH